MVLNIYDICLIEDVHKELIPNSCFNSLFQARKQYEDLKLLAVEDGGDVEQQSEATEALSTIVQVGDFSESLEAQEAIVALPHCELRKARSQMCRIKVSSSECSPIHHHHHHLVLFQFSRVSFYNPHFPFVSVKCYMRCY